MINKNRFGFWRKQSFRQCLTIMLVSMCVNVFDLKLHHLIIQKCLNMFKSFELQCVANNSKTFDYDKTFKIRLCLPVDTLYLLSRAVYQNENKNYDVLISFVVSNKFFFGHVLILQLSKFGQKNKKTHKMHWQFHYEQKRTRER